MVIWKMLERVHQAHRIPAHRTPPNVRRLTGFLVRPTLLFRFIPAVIKQPGLFIASVLFHPNKLVRNVVPIVFAENLRVLRIERLAHIEPVEPHLPRVYLLVPKAAFLGSRVRPELRAEKLNDLSILLVSRYAIHRHHRRAGRDVIDVVFLKMIVLMVSLFVDPMIHALLNVTKIFRIASRVPHLFDRLQDHSLFVVPPRWNSGLISLIYPDAVHRGIGEALG